MNINDINVDDLDDIVMVMNGETFDFLLEATYIRAFETDDPIGYLEIFQSIMVDIDDSMELNNVAIFDKEAYMKSKEEYE